MMAFAWPKRLGRLLGLAVYTVLFAELFLRLVAPQPLMPRYVTGTPWGVRGNIPDATYRHQTPEVTVSYAINSQGMRAPRDYPVAKPPGTCRVEMLGDSFFMSYELDYARSIAARIEAKLNERGFRAEVLNLAVSGFGTAETIRTYEAYGRTFDPDVVLFEWDSTDPDNNVQSRLFALDDQGLPHPAAERFLPGIAIQDRLMRSSLYRLIADESHLYSFTRESAAKLVQAIMLFVARPKTGDEAAYARRLSAALLLDAQDLVRRDGRHFILVEIPHQESRTRFTSSLAVLPREVRDAMDVVSPLAAFDAASRPDLKLYYERGHGHLSPVGADLLAEVVVERLAGLPALAKCPR